MNAQSYFDDITKIDDREVYRGLMGLYIQRDTLSWSRMQALGVIEIAVVGGAFATRELVTIPRLVIGIGIILVGLIWLLIERDWQCRDHLRDILDLVHNRRTIILSPKERLLTGRCVMRIIMGALLVMNVAFVFWNPISKLQNHDSKAIQVRTPGQVLLNYPLEPDKNINIEFDGTKVTFSATKP